jgi:hypothetical protein
MTSMEGEDLILGTDLVCPECGADLPLPLRQDGKTIAIDEVASIVCGECDWSGTVAEILAWATDRRRNYILCPVCQGKAKIREAVAYIRAGWFVRKLERVLGLPKSPEGSSHDR